MGVQRYRQFNRLLKHSTVTCGNIETYLTKKEMDRDKFSFNSELISIDYVNIPSNMTYFVYCLLAHWNIKKSLKSCRISHLPPNIRFCCHWKKSRGGKRIVTNLVRTYALLLQADNTLMSAVNMGNKCVLPLPLAQHTNSQLLERSAVDLTIVRLMSMYKGHICMHLFCERVLSTFLLQHQLRYKEARPLIVTFNSHLHIRECNQMV